MYGQQMGMQPAAGGGDDIYAGYGAHTASRYDRHCPQADRPSRSVRYNDYNSMIPQQEMQPPDMGMAPGTHAHCR
jgi:hypothetical protein